MTHDEAERTRQLWLTRSTGGGDGPYEPKGKRLSMSPMSMEVDTETLHFTLAKIPTVGEKQHGNVRLRKGQK